MVRIEKQIFYGKQHIDWRSVEDYARRYVGETVVVKESGDSIIIPSGFPGEYTGSEYSKKLKGGLAKTKANALQKILELVNEASNRRYIENQKEKHENDAKNGWYRYDVFFEIAVKGENENKIRWNRYRGTMVVRINDAGLFLHDIINIKKEASTPIES